MRVNSRWPTMQMPTKPITISGWSASILQAIIVWTNTLLSRLISIRVRFHRMLRRPKITIAAAIRQGRCRLRILTLEITFTTKWLRAWMRKRTEDMILYRAIGPHRVGAIGVLQVHRHRESGGLGRVRVHLLTYASGHVPEHHYDLK
jgi:hypothetical protein